MKKTGRDNDVWEAEGQMKVKSGSAESWDSTQCIFQHSQKVQEMVASGTFGSGGKGGELESVGEAVRSAGALDPSTIPSEDRRVCLWRKQMEGLRTGSSRHSEEKHPALKKREWCMCQGQLSLLSQLPEHRHIGLYLQRGAGGFSLGESDGPREENCKNWPQGSPTHNPVRSPHWDANS